MGVVSDAGEVVSDYMVDVIDAVVVVNNARDVSDTGNVSSARDVVSNAGDV